MIRVWRQNKIGFTLIELLVSIGIIALLSTMVTAAVNVTRKKVRDTERLHDMRQVLNALEMYHDASGQYPRPGDYGEGGATECGASDGWDSSTIDSNSNGIQWLDVLVQQGFFSKIPVDPNNRINCGRSYRYNHYAAGSFGCDPSKGDFFVLGVDDMEGTVRPYPQSLGWSCNITGCPTWPPQDQWWCDRCKGGGLYGTDCRNWQIEFDWTTGGFEK